MKRGALFSLALLFLFVNIAYQLKHFDRDQWIHNSRANKNEIVNITVALTLRNVDDLQKTFNDVSNPRHPNWRKYLTQAQIAEKYYPTSASVDLVSSFLYENGAIMVDSSYIHVISATFKVKDVEKLLKVELHNYKSIDGKQEIIRSPKMYTLPTQLEDYVDVIGLVSEFPALHLKAHTKFDRIEEQSMKLKQEIQGKNNQAIASEYCNALPLYGYPQTSDTDLYSQVQVVCCNGNFTADSVNPCSDYPPALTGFVVEARNNATGVVLFNDLVDLSSVQCYLDGTSVTCNLPWTLNTVVEPYQQYNLFVTEVFGSNNSATAMFPTQLVTSAFVTPQLFAQYYDIPLNYRGKAQNNIQSVAEFGGQYYAPSDLANFFGNMSIVGAPVTVVGSNNAQLPGDEATLVPSFIHHFILFFSLEKQDIEWIMAVGVGIPTTFWSVHIGYLLEWTAQLLNATNPPLVNSVSYAGNEVNSPVAYRNRVDQQFQLLGTRGVSIVVASGDAGATDVGHGYDACSPFQPQYPATSAYVTSVSATYFSPSAEPICSINYYGKKVHCSDLQMGEVAVAADNGMDWTTGGGFSNSVPRPQYQEPAVSHYLQSYSSLLPPTSMFNQSNRGYPDVSATGHNLLLILNNVMDIGDGTSAATPIFAGILSMLNDWLLANNEAPVGFANPLLYDIAANYPQAFYDVTYGDNKCGDVLHPPYIACCPYGYEASNGWDPVTGLGTPRYDALLSALQSYVAINGKK